MLQPGRCRGTGKSAGALFFGLSALRTHGSRPSPGWSETRMLSVEAVDLYYGASYTLRRVNLTARRGEVTCIMGRNGVGKTSLLRAIMGLQPIRGGRIAWDDTDLTALPTYERARTGLALVP